MNFTGKDGNIYKTFNSAFPNQHSKKNILGKQQKNTIDTDEGSPGNIRVNLIGNSSAESKLERRKRARRVQSAITFKRGIHA